MFSLLCVICVKYGIQVHWRTPNSQGRVCTAAWPRETREKCVWGFTQAPSFQCQLRNRWQSFYFQGKAKVIYTHFIAHSAIKLWQTDIHTGCSIIITHISLPPLQLKSAPVGNRNMKIMTDWHIYRLFHCAPNVPHYAKNKAVGVMKPGHCFTIEPMISEGVGAFNISKYQCL